MIASVACADPYQLLIIISQSLDTWMIPAVSGPCLRARARLRVQPALCQLLAQPGLLNRRPVSRLEAPDARPELKPDQARQRAEAPAHDPDAVPRQQRADQLPRAGGAVITQGTRRLGEGMREGAELGG